MILIDEIINTLNSFYVWYWALILLIVLIGIFGTYMFKDGQPILWAVILSIVLYFGHTYLENMLFGWQIMETGYYMYFSMAFAITWFILLAICLKNILTEGKVIL